MLHHIILNKNLSKVKRDSKPSKSKNKKNKDN